MATVIGNRRLRRLGGGAPTGIGRDPAVATIERHSLHVPDRMCEAYDYLKPAAFSRGMEVRLAGARLVFVSGTASVGPDGQSLHPGDFRGQARRAFENARAVLASAGADWHDVVKATVFLKDIRAHYEMFNEVRCAYFRELGLYPYPASTCVEARLCREELLIEMELIAAVPEQSHPAPGHFPEPSIHIPIG